MSQRWVKIGAFLIVALALAAPRAYQLGRYTTADESSWLTRSGNFYLAVVEGDFTKTLQFEAPGVPVFWAGALAFRLYYPTYAQDAPQGFTSEYAAEQQWRAHGIDPLTLLVTGRAIVVVLFLVLMLLAFWLLARLIGYPLATVGFLLAALDPFSSAGERLLQPDGILAASMLVSLLALYTYLFREKKKAYLILSGVAAGIGWLTKTPAFFLVFIAGALFLVKLWEVRAELRERPVSRIIAFLAPLLVWCGIGLAVLVAAFPALWVDPIGTMQKVFGWSIGFAEQGHSLPMFFRGGIYWGRPSRWYYPVNFLWRSTPVTLVGLILVLFFFIARRAPFHDHDRRHLAVVLAAFGALFALFMSVGAKSAARYLMPIFAPVSILAALGWAGLVEMIRGWLPGRSQLATGALLFTMVIAGQAAGVVQTAPYMQSYYNPLMGNAQKATQVISIGWGEGMDQVGRYLSAKPGAKDLHVLAWDYTGCLSYYFTGNVQGFDLNYHGPVDAIFKNVDYVVLYANQWQRNLPDKDTLDYIRTFPLETAVRLNGVLYAEVYRVPH